MEEPQKGEPRIPALRAQIYMSSLAWLAGFVRSIAEGSDYSVEQIEAQVHKDLKFILDPQQTQH